MFGVIWTEEKAMTKLTAMPDDGRVQSATNYARRVITGSFRQVIDDETMDEVVEKILQALPPDDREIKSA